jgi:hypothetical protein
MRIAICFPALAFLTACSVVPTPAWTFDPTQPQAKPPLAMAEGVGLTDRTAQMQLQRNDVRARISNEPDARRRIGLYGDLHRVGMELSPLERELASADAAR